MFEMYQIHQIKIALLYKITNIYICGLNQCLNGSGPVSNVHVLYYIETQTRIVYLK